MLSFALALVSALTPPDFRQDQVAWRKAHEATLTGPGGWLSVAGLYWLKEGSQTLGASSSADIRLPASAPAAVGTVTLAGGSVAIWSQGSVSILVNGQPKSGPLNENSDKVQIGNLILSVIKRGARTGLRLWDPNAKSLKEFKGCRWYSPDPAYVIKAKFVRHKAGTTIPITNVLGDTQPSPNPGYIEFRIHGKTCRLEAQSEGDGLFFNFRDTTSGKETYPAGRFLSTPGPKNGFVTVDFNHSENPPCAFTAFATCPLPPKGNSLKVRIAAGELTHHP